MWQNTPAKNKEDLPLSRMIPRNAPVIRDLRDQIGDVIPPDPFNRERTDRAYSPRQQSPPRQLFSMRRRPHEIWNLGQRPANTYSNQTNPWLQTTDSRADSETAHHSRSFIENQHTSRDEGTMTDLEPGAPTREEEEADPYDSSRGQNKQQ